jgi:DNA-binding LacI/PurR family transcriptional regulator
VSQDVRSRITQAVQELGYRPNVVARSLTRGRSYAIGMVVANITNPFYTELIAGSEEVLSRAGFTVLLGSTNNESSAESVIVDSMVQRQVDGVIMASVTMRDREVKRLAESGLDVVLASRNLKKTLVDTVVTDDLLGGRIAAEHLISHGYSRITHFGGPQDTLPFQLRQKGFESAAAEAGVSCEVLVVEAPRAGVAPAQDAVRKVLQSKDRTRAIFAGSDAIALGIMMACAELGLSIPNDVALIGFDNTWVGGMPGVSLATVDGQTRLIGVTAANLLTARIEARWGSTATNAAPELVVLQPQLVARRSCGCTEGKPGEFPIPEGNSVSE